MDEKDTLRRRLMEAGILRRTASGNVEAESDMPLPWYVRAMHAFFGWLASIFVVLMFGAMFHRLFDTPIVLLAVGVVLLFGAYFMLKNVSDSDFMLHGALALSFAAQAMIGFALAHFFEVSYRLSPLWWFVMAAMEAALFFLIRQALHRFVSAFLFGLFLYAGAWHIGAGMLVVPLLFAASSALWLSELRPPEGIFWKQSAGNGLTAALLWILFIQPESFWWLYGMHSSQHPLSPLILTLLNAGIFAGVLYTLMHRRDMRISLKIMAWGGALAIVPLAYWMHGLIIALTLLIVGFARGNLVLTGLGIASLLWSVGRFYYMLHTTLLVKSMLLIGSGMTLLLLYVAIRRLSGDNGKKGEMRAR